ncbi:MAG: hypothetical protein COU07_00715 [Candidatus Harrisonbacteria bacterium CG10_big_fil_rev_8_21_14_0_10_40_38]|uniref:DUF218 domain-containing protein n=1 Tax=Candidatus Harrisonbacteria bacterium CG10_big_fil_rev_8_21_14_0_10_40_38 TaxID=1974583 RepID=A0A2H0USP2_9BACT|nr:MAG: hypothetical protein COU07_00715 [Candidatus Harrisonbacteria bacterium CG10_big_fil_rev_8_21_14_0_10_40_38]
MSKVVIVCGYGCHLTEKYEAYLRNAGDIIKYNESEIDFVVVSGGLTNIATSSVSEAGLMKNVLQRCGVSNEIVEEVGAVTTLGNLTGSNVIVRAAIAQKYLVPDDICVLIFCDSIRAFKVEFLARRVFGRIRVAVIPFDFQEELQG